jgi:hypothetical protein
MFKILIKIFIALFFIASSIYSQNLQLSISLEKTSFLVGEKIFVDLNLKNISSEDIEVTILWDGYVNGLIFFNIINEFNEKTDYVGGNIDFGAKYPILKPGDEELGTIEILKLYGKKEDYIYQLKPGTYTISVDYLYRNDKITSNQLTFTINAPRGNDLEAFELFKEANHMYFTENRDEDAARLYRKGVDTYSKSNYSMLFLDRLASVYSIGLRNYKESNNVYEELIRKHPMSKLAEEVVGSMIANYSNLKDFQAMEANIEKIYEEYKNINPKLAKKAKALLINEKNRYEIYE